MTTTQKPGTSLCLDCSVKHLENYTLRNLTSFSGTNALGITIAEYEYGFFLTVPVQEEDESDADMSKCFGPDLWAVLKKARSMGCSLVQLDADGFEHPDLTNYADLHE